MNANSLRASLGKLSIGAAVGLSILVIYAVVSLTAPLIAPFGETEIVGQPYEPWSQTFVFGTDNLGRDVLSRLIYGARNTVAIALVTTILAFVIGVGLSLISATLGGWVDLVIGRMVDVFMAIPLLIFALLILAVVGNTLFNLVLVSALLESTRVYRVARPVAAGIEVMDYVEIARLRGENLWWLTAREILPNALAPLVTEFGIRFCFVFLFITALSFLGLGLQPPAADWGSMVRENATLITFGVYTPLLPALAIGILTVGVNFVVDWFVNLSSNLEK